MARSPAILGRPSPQRKHRSGTASSTSAASLLPTRAPITKALKRAQKRASLLRKTGVTTEEGDDEHQSARSLLQHGGSISKSALRRRKRKERDELAKDVSQGRQGGVKDLADAVEELEEEIMGAEEGYSGRANSGRITVNHRRRVLQEEQQRQKAILSNPEYQASPFAALRTHLQSTMAGQTKGR